jgi:DNA-binding LytR/AlgR family response regulator
VSTGCGSFLRWGFACSFILLKDQAAKTAWTKDFIRIHRSYIVAKKQIKKMDKKSIWINQTELPIGLAYVEEIEKIGN